MKLVQDRKLQLMVIFAAALLVRLCAMYFLETYMFRMEHSFGYGYGETAKHVVLGEGFSLGYYDSGIPRA